MPQMPKNDDLDGYFPIPTPPETDKNVIIFVISVALVVSLIIAGMLAKENVKMNKRISNMLITEEKLVVDNINCNGQATRCVTMLKETIGSLKTCDAIVKSSKHKHGEK